VVNNPPLDSYEGMRMLADFARAAGLVLNEAHEKMAAKHGVELDGVTIARPISHPIIDTHLGDIEHGTDEDQ
jgi:hypothetical protein